MKPRRPARHDYEYERNGTVNLFMLFAPLEAWRYGDAEWESALDGGPCFGQRELRVRHTGIRRPSVSGLMSVMRGTSTSLNGTLWGSLATPLGGIAFISSDTNSKAS